MSLSTQELKAKLDALQQKRAQLFVEVENTQKRQALRRRRGLRGAARQSPPRDREG